MTRQIGLCAAVFGDLDLDSMLDSVAALPVDFLDLPTDTTLAFNAGIDDLSSGAHGDRVAQALQARRLTVRCVSNSRDTQLLLGPYGSHTDPVCLGSREEKLAHADRCARATISLAARTGAEQVRLYFGSPDYALWLDWRGSSQHRSNSVRALADAAVRYLKLCRDAGLTLSIEPHVRQAVYDPITARQLVDELVNYADVFRLCIDPANFAAIGWDPARSVRGWGPALGAVHVKDLQRWEETPERRVPDGWSHYGPHPPIRFRSMGWGVLPWKDIISALLDEGFSGPVYIEHEDLLIPREEGVGSTAAALRALLPATAPEGRTW
ncbi:MAG: sugar phosphate isomerase/epimerase [Pseudonocardiaceae bacterium]